MLALSSGVGLHSSFWMLKFKKGLLRVHEKADPCLFNKFTFTKLKSVSKLSSPLNKITELSFTKKRAKKNTKIIAKCDYSVDKWKQSKIKKLAKIMPRVGLEPTAFRWLIRIHWRISFSRIWDEHSTDWVIQATNKTNYFFLMIVIKKSKNNLFVSLFPQGQHQISAVARSRLVVALL